MDVKFLPMDESLLSVTELRTLVSEAVISAADFFSAGADMCSDDLRRDLLLRLKGHLQDYVLIRVRGELAGVYCFYGDGASMTIYDLYIIPEYRCRGLATKAVERCISSTEQPIFVQLYNADRFSISLFKRMGFRREKELSVSLSRWLYDNCDPF